MPQPPRPSFPLRPSPPLPLTPLSPSPPSPLLLPHEGAVRDRRDDREPPVPVPDGAQAPAVGTRGTAPCSLARRVSCNCLFPGPPRRLHWAPGVVMRPPRRRGAERATGSRARPRAGEPGSCRGRHMPGDRRRPEGPDRRAPQASRCGEGAPPKSPAAAAHTADARRRFGTGGRAARGRHGTRPPLPPRRRWRAPWSQPETRYLGMRRRGGPSPSRRDAH